MPSKNKSNKKGKNKPSEKAKRILELKQDLEEYAKIDKMLGNGRVYVIYVDGSVILAHIRGSLRRCKMTVGDIVLVSIRDFQQDKCDIIHKYEKEEVKKLFNLGEIPLNFLDESREQENEDDIIFEETEADTDIEFESI